MMLKRNRKIGANLIFTLNGEPIRNGVIEISPSYDILSISGNNPSIPHISGLEYYPGIIIPGLIYGDINTNKTIVLSDNTIKSNNAYRKLWKNGVQLVGITSEPTTEPFYELKETDNFSETLYSISKNGCINTKYYDKYGSIEKGKSPGIINISGYDFKQKRLLSNATIKRII